MIWLGKNVEWLIVRLSIWPVFSWRQIKGHTQHVHSRKVDFYSDSKSTWFEDSYYILLCPICLLLGQDLGSGSIVSVESPLTLVDVLIKRLFDEKHYVISIFIDFKRRLIPLIVKYCLLNWITVVQGVMQTRSFDLILQIDVSIECWMVSSLVVLLWSVVYHKRLY